MLKIINKNCFVFILGLGCCFSLLAEGNPDPLVKIIVEQEAETYAYLKNLSAEQKQALQEKAESGDAQSQFLLAKHYGKKKELGEAFHWLEKAASQGDMQAQRKLSTWYVFEQGDAKDDKKAFDWMEKAAAQGDMQAQCILGIFYLEGQGISKDEKKAFEWLEKSALQGYSEAQCILGILYHEGRGAAKDERKAVEWLTKAAVQGDVRAQKILDALK